MGGRNGNKDSRIAAPGGNSRAVQTEMEKASQVTCEGVLAGFWSRWGTSLNADFPAHAKGNLPLLFVGA